MSHNQTEMYRWTILIADHPPRAETAGYRASRSLMTKIMQGQTGWILGDGPYQDHHGGSVWVQDADGWLCVQLPLGIEWSAQFCADPAKIDRLRLVARRLLKAFPDTIAAYEALGYSGGQALLDEPIHDAAGVADWTDSIFNASMPLPAQAHVGVLPEGAGYHHYPKPIVDIEHFRRDDYRLFVTDQDGLPAVVVPVSADPGDGRVRLLAASAASEYAALIVGDGNKPPSGHHDHRELVDARSTALGGPEPLDHSVLPPTDRLARMAFAK